MNQYEGPRKKHDSLIDFFKQAPFPDVELDIKRSEEKPREITNDIPPKHLH